MSMSYSAIYLKRKTLILKDVSGVNYENKYSKLVLIATYTLLQAYHSSK
jgi:hypothetical protein